MTDIAIRQLDNGSFDIGIDAGDLLADNGLRTAVIISLFTDREANPDDVIPDGTKNRRGHWADAYAEDGDKIGSRLWLLSRAKEIDETLNDAEAYTNEALQHFIDDGIASKVESAASWVGDGRLDLKAVIFKSDETLFDGVFNISLKAL